MTACPVSVKIPFFVAHIAKGNFVFAERDVISIIASPRSAKTFFAKINYKIQPIKDTLIVGGGAITHYLCELLEKSGISVKVIEKNTDRAVELAEEFDKATVINADPTDEDVLREEGIGSADSFIALTGLDEGNILSALYAKRKDVHKVIVKVTSDNLLSMFKGKELETIVSPKLVTINEILIYVRALAASDSDGNVLSLYKIVGGKVEVLEFEASEDMTELVNKPLSVLKLKKNVLVACIVRKGKALVPKGSDAIMAGDSVLIVTANQRIMNLEDILEE